MPYEKGESGNPAGRPKGSKNRSTSAMREAIAQLIDENIDFMADWLHQVAKDDPKAAFQCLLHLMEFNVPRMSRIVWRDEAKEFEDRQNSSCESTDNFMEAAMAAIETAEKEKKQKWREEWEREMGFRRS